MDIRAIRSNVAKKREDITKRKIEAATTVAKEILSSDSFNNSVLQLPDAKMDIERLLNQTFTQVVNPVNDFIDVLTNKGYKPADIRKAVNKLYSYVVGDSTKEASYEEKLQLVADTVAEKQELYVFIDLGNIREEDE